MINNTAQIIYIPMLNRTYEQYSSLHSVQTVVWLLQTKEHKSGEQT